MNQMAEMADLKAKIAALYAHREQLKNRVEQASMQTRRSLWVELESVDQQLSEFDTRYKQLWDAQHTQ